MRVWRTAAQLAAILALLAPGCLGRAQDAWNFPGFSARQVFLRGDEEISFRVYRWGPQVRAEMNSALSTLYDAANDHICSLTVTPL